MAFLKTPRSQRGSALLIVLVVALVALASLVGIATFKKSAIPSSPASYQAQIVSATPTPSPIAFVQSNSATLNGQKSSITTSYQNTQTQGNLNVVIVGWQGGGNSVADVTDTLGNTYTQVLQNRGTGISQALYYAKNIKSGSNNVVTATYASAAFSPRSSSFSIAFSSLLENRKTAPSARAINATTPSVTLT